LPSHGTEACAKIIRIIIIVAMYDYPHDDGTFVEVDEVCENLERRFVGSTVFVPSRESISLVSK
jgi:hypothetical protein